MAANVGRSDPKASAKVFKIDTSKIVAALAPFGPTPVVCTVIGIAALAALSLHADHLAVICVVVLSLGTHIYIYMGKNVRRRFARRNLRWNLTRCCGVRVRK